MAARLFGRVAATTSAGRRLLAAARAWVGEISDKFGTGPIRLRETKLDNVRMVNVCLPDGFERHMPAGENRSVIEEVRESKQEEKPLPIRYNDW